MPLTKSAEEGQELGGGIWLLPNKTGFLVEHKFRLAQLYSIGSGAFYVKDDGLVADAIRLLGLKRLQAVCQLQMMSTVSVESCKKTSDGPHIFPHNRLIHSLCTAVGHAIIGRVCGLTPKQIELGILADLLHDVFTCAGGDSWKDINHQGKLFDEDNDFAGKIWCYFGKDWEKLCEKYGLDPVKTALAIQDIVHGNGLSGEIHEIVDTASYMLMDLQEIGRLSPEERNSEDFREILEAAKHPWDIWNSVAEVDGHIVIRDPIRLNNFLLLRVLLWKNFYNNPSRKVLEMLMQKVVYPYVVSRGLVKISNLPTMMDKQLFNLVEREMGWAKGQSSCLDLLGSFPRIEAFATWAEALAFEERRVSRGDFTLVFSVNKFQKTISKTGKYRVRLDEKVGTFAEMYEEHAAMVEGIAKDSMFPTLPVQVVYVENPVVSGSLRLAWQEARVLWRRNTD